MQIYLYNKTRYRQAKKIERVKKGLSDQNNVSTVADVKKSIETAQGQDVYPAVQQMLIHQGKVLKDTTTLEENKVAENSFVVIMLSKNKVSTSGTSATQPAPSNSAQPATSTGHPTQTVTAPQATAASVTPAQAAPESAPTPDPAPAAANPVADVYGQAASNLVAGNTLEATVQQILDMGGGSWDRDTVVRALRAAFNNPERAIEYLYSGIPEQTEIPSAAAPASGHAVNPPVQASQPAVPSGGPNANPLDLFPQFQALRAMVQANPQILQVSHMAFNFKKRFYKCFLEPGTMTFFFTLQPMLQELGKQNPQLMRLIQEHQADFLRLINEPVEGEGNVPGQPAGAIPQAMTVTPEEREAIERLEAMGFDRALVLQVFFACNKNEELAANYLLDHMHEFDE
ncbi:hypothetical protein RND71_019523 [Anisodus tanguticus]|uniref:Ubiquitin receptor RAD23 n=1 Tax=Anisodus tanguticus TaxID=243964 RepID=A0AAE1RZ96_9SOLA|nr:hypothetical protein RND71_019523 [Anisodus tanguticus]